MKLQNPSKGKLLQYRKGKYFSTRGMVVLDLSNNFEKVEGIERQKNKEKFKEFIIKIRSLSKKYKIFFAIFISVLVSIPIIIYYNNIRLFNSYVTKGNTYMSNSQYSEAKASFVLALKYHSDNLILEKLNLANFNLNVVKGNTYMSSEQYLNAESSFELALKYHSDNSILEKHDLAEALANSLNCYNQGIIHYKDNDFLNASLLFSSVSPKDTKRYSDAQSRLQDSKRKFFESINNIANQGDYTDAISQLTKSSSDLYANLFTNDKLEIEQLEKQYQSDADLKSNTEAEARAKDQAKEETDAKALEKTQGVRIGMTEQEVLDSSWGKPQKTNKTITAYGTTEQWVYADGNGYLYFDNGILTAVQN
ncbi:hypothetical protein [Desulfosporosinus sp. FKB]|uniref:hypothetical protein n=1 Tax=Desulfosporosinus sp. FKB TaxID=1969835 RepID=UPI000B4A378C|nr:hypothetical protein [Desulfosporosinus sp. FKB]